MKIVCLLPFPLQLLQKVQTESICFKHLQAVLIFVLKESDYRVCPPPQNTLTPCQNLQRSAITSSQKSTHPNTGIHQKNKKSSQPQKRPINLKSKKSVSLWKISDKSGKKLSFLTKLHEINKINHQKWRI